MPAATVTIVNTGIPNLASTRAAFTRLGIDVVITESPLEVADAEFVVLPGTRAFAPTMADLEANGLVDPLRTRIAERRPTLATGIGFQLLATRSEESPSATGLGVIDAEVERLRGAVSVPQVGWNRIEAPTGATLLRSGSAYFANAYVLREAPPGWRAATAQYGPPFVAALESGPVLACQFHPELSGVFGESLLSRWLVKGAVPCSVPA